MGDHLEDQGWEDFQIFWAAPKTKVVQVSPSMWRNWCSINRHAVVHVNNHLFSFTFPIIICVRNLQSRMHLSFYFLGLTKIMENNQECRSLIYQVTIICMIVSFFCFCSSRQDLLVVTVMCRWWSFLRCCYVNWGVGDQNSHMPYSLGKRLKWVS